MTREEFAARGARALGSRWRAHVPLAPLTTFRLGGPAEWLADVHTVDELQAVIADARAAVLPVTFLGGGSNVLVADEGIAGLVVRLHLTGLERIAPDEIRAGAGVTINGLVRWSIGRGLAGLEAWAGTPGTVGGAICGNAHWQRRNIGDCVRRVSVLTRTGTLQVVPRADMGFGYDTSRLRDTGEVVVSADFGVAPGNPEHLRATARASLHYRKRTQPLAAPSAGCIFQNPDPDRDPVPGDIPFSAGALVDRAGLKGSRIGGAMISPTHGNFIVNDGSATAADVRALIELARQTVRARFGVTLRDEIVLLG